MRIASRFKEEKFLLAARVVATIAWLFEHAVMEMRRGVALIAAAINLNDGETNAIEGMTHFILFATFVMLTAPGL